MAVAVETNIPEQEILSAPEMQQPVLLEWVTDYEGRVAAEKTTYHTTAVIEHVDGSRNIEIIKKHIKDSPPQAVGTPNGPSDYPTDELGKSDQEIIYASLFHLYELQQGPVGPAIDFLGFGTDKIEDGHYVANYLSVAGQNARLDHVRRKTGFALQIRTGHAGLASAIESTDALLHFEKLHASDVETDGHDSICHGPALDLLTGSAVERVAHTSADMINLLYSNPEDRDIRAKYDKHFNNIEDFLSIEGIVQDISNVLSGNQKGFDRLVGRLGTLMFPGDSSDENIEIATAEAHAIIARTEAIIEMGKTKS